MSQRQGRRERPAPDRSLAPLLPRRHDRRTRRVGEREGPLTRVGVQVRAVSDVYHSHGALSLPRAPGSHNRGWRERPVEGRWASKMSLNLGQKGATSEPSALYERVENPWGPGGIPGSRCDPSELDTRIRSQWVRVQTFEPSTHFSPSRPDKTTYTGVYPLRTLFLQRYITRKTLTPHTHTRPMRRTHVYTLTGSDP